MQAKIAIVVARFTQHVTQKLLDGCLARLQALGVNHADIQVVWVPGAVEIPLITQQFAKQKKVDAIIALGAVVQGETGHYDYVCNQVSEGCQRVMLDYDIPVIFGVLTTNNLAQAMDRVGGNHGHKGASAADTAIEMLTLMKEFEI